MTRRYKKSHSFSLPPTYVPLNLLNLLTTDRSI